MSYLEYKTPAYNLLGIHNLMLLDSIRTRTYAKAIKVNIKKGDVVVDVGTGTGILALLAVKAGAKKVYAIEPTEIIGVARNIARDNGLENKIQFMNCRAEEAEIPEKVDCVLSEWMGVFGIQDNMLPSVISIRDRYLKTEGKILPDKVSLHLALVSSERIYHETVGKWRKSFQGLDYNHFADRNANDTHLITARPGELASNPIILKELDIKNGKIQRQYNENVKLVVKKGKRCHGVLGWFNAGFPKNITLDTSPYKPVTHWQQLFFPFKNPINPEEHEKINLSFKIREDRKNHRLMNFKWDLINTH